MKFRLYSDLHLEFGKFKNWPKEDCSDIVLILAGDIGVGLQARPMIETMCKYYRAVVLVSGNHEYYQNNITLIDKRYKQLDSILPNFHYLQNETIVIDGIRFIGGTMWTGLDNGDWFALEAAKRGMNDFHVIKHYNMDRIPVRFDVYDCMAYHKLFKDYLSTQLAKPFDKTIVVTHHAPCELSVAERYKGNRLNSAYYEDMTQFMFGDNAPDIWCHGHMHDSIDYTVGNTRVIANPRGYIGHALNSRFDVMFEFDL